MIPLRLILLIGLFSLVSLRNSHAQDSTSSSGNNQLWLDFYPSFYVAETWEWLGNGGFRYLEDGPTWKFYLRPSVRFFPLSNHIEFYGGVSFFYDLVSDAANSLEIRPWQGVKARWPILLFNYLTFAHFVRLEERITLSSIENSFQFRGRYQISTRADLVGELFVPISFELFANIDDAPLQNPTDQWRLATGLGWDQSRVWTYEVQIVLQESRSGSDDTFGSNDWLLQLKVKKFLETPPEVFRPSID